MGLQHIDIPRNVKVFMWFTRTNAKMKVLQQKRLILMGKPYCTEILWWHSVTNVKPNICCNTFILAVVLVHYWKIFPFLDISICSDPVGSPGPFVTECHQNS